MIKKYRVLRPIALGGRRERGEVIEMAEETALGIGAEYLAEVAQAEPVESAKTEETAKVSPSDVSDGKNGGRVEDEGSSSEAGKVEDAGKVEGKDSANSQN